MSDDKCREIALAIVAIQQEIADLSEELKFAATGQKAGLAQQIRRLTQELGTKRRRLRECLGVPAPRPSITVTFSGTATLTISDARFPGPFDAETTATATFDSPRTALSLDSLAPIPATFNTPIGPNTTTVTLDSTKPRSGTFDPNTGQTTLSITLKFDHSLPDIIVGDSDAPITLTTGAGSGSPLSRSNGRIVLVGASTFVRGFLNGTGFSMVLAGTMSPLPFP